jgi:hypothetical protein
MRSCIYFKCNFYPCHTIETYPAKSVKEGVQLCNMGSNCTWGRCSCA